MKKRLLTILLAVLLTFGQATAVDLYVDGARLAPDVPPTLVNGRTLVPLRSIFEALDATVFWDEATQTASAQAGSDRVQVTLGSTTAYHNGAACTLDVPAQLIGGRTMVPARFVSESLGARVLWDAPTQTVFILSADHEELVVEYLDVGQADSILLSSDGEYMLIDAGNNQDGDDVVAYLRSVGADELKYAVGTHAHADHIGGLDDVILDLDVDAVWLPSTSSDTLTYAAVLAAAKSRNLAITVPQAGDTFTLGQAEIEVLAAQTSNDLNDTSLVLQASYEDTSFLFMGDAGTAVENNLLMAGADLRSDVLKVGHHGSSTSTSAAFLAAVSPEAAVISCGAGNSYGHPHQATLDRLAGVAVWRTDRNGTIIAMTDGKDCTLTASQGAASTGGQTSAPSGGQTSKPSGGQTSTPSGGQTVQPSQTGTVYITPTGKRYHLLSSCAGKNARSTTLSDALSRGLTPCKKCAS